MIKDLSDGDKGIDLRVEIIEAGEIRGVVSSKTGQAYRVTDVIAKDPTGIIPLTLWNDDIEKVTEGSMLLLTNAYVTEWKGLKRLNIGRYGVMRILIKGNVEKT